MTDHPSTEQLQQLFGEPLDGDLTQPLLDHLHDCAACTDALEQLSADPLVERWRQLLAKAPLDERRGLSPPSDRRNKPGGSSSLYATMPPPADETLSLPRELPRTTGPLTGRKLGKYQLLHLLGQGGMGQVYAAADNLGRHVALKVMHGDLAASEEARQRFLREARAAAALQHNHVISLFEADEAEGVLYLVMPLLQGQTLKDRLQHGPPLTVAEILQIGRETAAGLVAAHAQGLIHRDIKPANLFLERLDAPGHASGRVPFQVRILDFGLARAQDGSDAVTGAGIWSGTLYFMSPEQVACQALDGRSDLFSLGSLLYLLATGVVPFQGDNPAALALAVLKSEPKPPHERNPTIPPPLSQLILRLLAKDLDRRPKTAAAVVDAFRALEAGRSAAPPEQPSTAAGKPVEGPTMTYISGGRQTSGKSASPWWRRRGLLVALAPAVAATVAVILLGVFQPWRQPESERAESPAAPPKQPEKPGPLALKGFLDIQVTEPGNKLRQQLMLHQPLALPLKKGMKMEIEAEVNRPAYLYLVYLDSNGEATPLEPWQDYDWQKRPATEERRLRLPYRGDLTPSPSGVESLLLLVREERLPDDVDMPALFAGLPKQKKLPDPRARAWFENGVLVSHHSDRGRPVGVASDDPVGQTQALLRDRLRQLFPYTRAVYFAFQGE